MKRLIIGFPVFAIAFLVGYVMAPKIHKEYADATVPVQTIEQQVQPEPNPVPASISDKADYFVPEFRDLPDFDDLDYFALDGKLVDLSGDGIYRRSEVVARNGEPWLVFRKATVGYSLVASTARVKKLNSVSWPGDEKDSKLTFDVRGKPILALRDIRGVSPGSAETLFLQTSYGDENADLNSEELSQGYRREFLLNNRSYVLRTSRGLSKDGIELAVLVIESSGSIQVIDWTRHFADDRDIIGNLLWVGDLDRDGKLDLYFDNFNEIGAFSAGLYLSSYARHGELVRLVATFGTAGC